MKKTCSILVVSQSFTETLFKVSLRDQILILSKLGMEDVLSQGQAVDEDVLDLLFSQFRNSGSLVNKSFGGVGPNVAYVLSRLGISTTLMSAMGHGDNSKLFLKKMSHPNLQILSNFSLNDIGRCLSFVDSEKDVRTMLVSLPNEENPAFLNFEELLQNKSFDLVVLNGDLVHFKEKEIQFLKYLKNQGIKICLVSTEVGVFSNLLNNYHSALKYVDIFTCNKEQASFVASCDQKDCVIEIRKFLKPSCINMITDGPNDMYISQVCNNSIDICTFTPTQLKSDEVVSPVGAGDAAAAGLIFGIINQLDMFSCAQIASIFGREGVKSEFSHLSEEQIFSVHDEIKSVLKNFVACN